jgi:hypothetical protein
MLRFFGLAIEAGARYCRSQSNQTTPKRIG